MKPKKRMKLPSWRQKQRRRAVAYGAEMAKERIAPLIMREYFARGLLAGLVVGWVTSAAVFSLLDWIGAL